MPCWCCVCAVSLPWPCRVSAVVCRVFAVVLPCFCRGFAVCLSCRGRVSLLCVCPYRVFAVNLQCIVLVFFCGCTPAPPPESGNPGKSGFESPSDQPASLPKPIPATCCDELVHVACPAIWQGATNVCEERLSRHKRITSLAGPHALRRALTAGIPNIGSGVAIHLHCACPLSCSYGACQCPYRATFLSCVAALLSCFAGPYSLRI